MYFCISYSQNVFKYLVQVVYFIGIMVDEFGFDVVFVCCVGLMYDVGKSIDCEIEGIYVEIGINFVWCFGEFVEVIDVIVYYYDFENGEMLYLVLVVVVDVISVVWFGVWCEVFEFYVCCFEQFEQIVVVFFGVQQVYVIQVGCEVCVIVQFEKVIDVQVMLFVCDIVGWVEQDMEYFGQVQVMVVCESWVVGVVC